MNVGFHPVARDEMFDSALHYESKRTGLGSEFRTDDSKRPYDHCQVSTSIVIAEGRIG